jgi:choloylglycine hydrolase
MRPLAAAAAAAVALLAPAAAHPCSAFLARVSGTPVVGKSYDWDTGEGLVLWNKRGVAKRAAVARPGDRPAEWVSRHASLTFNQYGREFPNGGMNDAGLVVEVLWLDRSEAADDGRPAVNELQWIQYQLDRHATVAEVVAGAGEVRIAPAYARVHYFACDKGGACATFELLGGKLRVHAGAELPLAALTNHTYEESLAHARGFRGLGGEAPPRPGRGSLDRFVRAAGSAREAAGAPDAPGAAFGILDAVSQGEYSKWQIVYLPGSSQVMFRTRRAGTVKVVDLSRLDGSCGTPVKMLDVDHAAGGDVTAALADYAPAANAALVERTLGRLDRGELPPEAKALVAAYPESLACSPGR